MSEELNKIDWSIPDTEGNIIVPEQLVPLFNKIVTQMRFHTISGKSEILTVAHIVQLAEAFFSQQK